MRKVLLTLILSLLSLTFFAQDSLLQKFKFRNVNYRAVILYLNGYGQYNSTTLGSGKSEGHAGSANLGTSYSLVKSTDRVFINAYGGLSTSYNSSHSGNNSIKDHAFYFTPQLGVLNKWFSKKLFIESGADGYMGIFSSKGFFAGPANTTKSNRHEYALSVTGGIGTGRLENITDMQNALWLADALHREGRLSRSLTPQELNNLGNAIIKANNTRVLDYRKRVQFSLATVDQYLQQNGLVEKTDITYFSNLNDVLFFAINLPRLSGTEKYIRLTPSIKYFDQEQSQSSPGTNDDIHATSQSARLSIGIRRYIPVSLHHQNNYGIGVYGSYLENSSEEKYYSSGVLVSALKLKPILRQAGAEMFFEHAVYPNTRTVISFNFQAAGGYEKIDNESAGFGNVGLTGTLNYFISYRTRLTGSIGLLYQKNIYQLSNYYLEQLPDNTNLNASAGLEINL